MPAVLSHQYFRASLAFRNKKVSSDCACEDPTKQTGVKATKQCRVLLCTQWKTYDTIPLPGFHPRAQITEMGSGQVAKRTGDPMYKGEEAAQRLLVR